LIFFEGKAAIFIMNMDLAIFIEFPVRGVVVVMHDRIFHWTEHCSKGGIERKRRKAGKRGSRE
jgi:hypothetical protein